MVRTKKVAKKKKGSQDIDAGAVQRQQQQQQQRKGGDGSISLSSSLERSAVTAAVTQPTSDDDDQQEDVDNSSAVQSLVNARDGGKHGATSAVVAAGGGDGSGGGGVGVASSPKSAQQEHDRPPDQREEENPSEEERDGNGNNNRPPLYTFVSIEAHRTRASSVAAAGAAGSGKKEEPQLQVLWYDGSRTWEPARNVMEDDPRTFMRYVDSVGLGDMCRPGSRSKLRGKASWRALLFEDSDEEKEDGETDGIADGRKVASTSNKAKKKKKKKGGGGPRSSAAAAAKPSGRQCKISGCAKIWQHQKDGMCCAHYSQTQKDETKKVEEAKTKKTGDKGTDAPPSSPIKYKGRWTEFEDFTIRDAIGRAEGTGTTAAQVFRALSEGCMSHRSRAAICTRYYCDVKQNEDEKRAAADVGAAQDSSPPAPPAPAPPRHVLLAGGSSEPGNSDAAKKMSTAHANVLSTHASLPKRRRGGDGGATAAAVEAALAARGRVLPVGSNAATRFAATSKSEAEEEEPREKPAGKNLKKCRIQGCAKYKQKQKDGMCCSHYTQSRSAAKQSQSQQRRKRKSPPPGSASMASQKSAHATVAKKVKPSASSQDEEEEQASRKLPAAKAAAAVAKRVKPVTLSQDEEPTSNLSHLQYQEQQKSFYHLPLPPVSSPTNYHGVCYNRTHGRYEAFLMHDDKPHGLGMYVLASDAARAFDTCARMLKGPPSHGTTNFSSIEEYETARSREIIEITKEEWRQRRKFVAPARPIEIELVPDSVRAALAADAVAGEEKNAGADQEERKRQRDAEMTIRRKEMCCNYIGVTHQRGKYRADITDSGKGNYIGLFDFAADAANAYDRECRRLRGYHWRTNFNTMAEFEQAREDEEKGIIWRPLSDPQPLHPPQPQPLPNLGLLLQGGAYPVPGFPAQPQFALPGHVINGQLYALPIPIIQPAEQHPFTAHRAVVSPPPPPTARPAVATPSRMEPTGTQSQLSPYVLQRNEEEEATVKPTTNNSTAGSESQEKKAKGGVLV